MNTLQKKLTSIGRLILRLAGDDQSQRLMLPALESFPDAPDLFQQYRHFAAHPELKRVPGGWQYAGKIYPDLLTVGGAGTFIFRTAKKHCLGNGIEVGAGLWPLLGAVPIDIWRGPGAGRSLEDIPANSQDYVFSSHCLEHVAEWRAELEAWIGKIRPGGVIFLYLPHPDCGIWNPGSPMVGNEHKWQPTPQIVRSELVARGLRIVAEDEGPDAMMSFYVCAEKSSEAA